MHGRVAVHFSKFVLVLHGLRPTISLLDFGRPKIQTKLLHLTKNMLRFWGFVVVVVVVVVVVLFLGRFQVQVKDERPARAGVILT